MSQRTVAYQFFLLFFLATTAFAAPGPRPKSACEICTAKIQSYDAKLKRLFTECFSDQGERSPAQHYCLLGLFFDSWKSIQPTAVPPDDAKKFIDACVAQYRQAISPEAPLDLSELRQTACMFVYSERIKAISIERFNCQLTCEPSKEPVLGSEALPSEELQRNVIIPNP